MRFYTLPAACCAVLFLPLPAPASPFDVRPEPVEQKAAGSAPCEVIRDPVGGQLIATCEVEGKPVRLLVDTGASHTTLDSGYAQRTFPDFPRSQVELAGGNVQQAPTLMSASLRADLIEVKRHPLFLMDLSGANGILKTNIQGILGINTMGCLPFVFNAREAVYRSEPGLQLRKGMKKLHGFIKENGLMIVEAKVGEQTIPLLLDTGSSVTILPVQCWKAGSEKPLRLDVADINGRGEEETQLGRPMDLEIGEGLVLKNVRPVLTTGSEAMLGLDALRQIELYYLPEKTASGTTGTYYGKPLDTPEP